MIRDGQLLGEDAAYDAEPAQENLLDPTQDSLFEGEEFARWHAEWQNMPEFVQEDQSSIKSIVVHFASQKDLADFGRLIRQRIAMTTRSIWFPEAEIGHFADLRYDYIGIEEDLDEEPEP